MSNIVKTREDLLKLKDYINLIKTNCLNKETIEEIVTEIVPKDNEGKNLVNISINQDDCRTAIYIPELNTLKFSVEKCKNWVEVNSNEVGDFYNVKDREMFACYLILTLMLHEVEHSYQYLIGQGKVDCSIPMVKKGYKTLTELLTNPNYILPHPIKRVRRIISIAKYCSRQYDYVLERNASSEAYSAAVALAYDSGHEEMMDIFTDMTYCYLTIGYKDDSKGAFYHTFKDLLMMDKYRRICDKTSISEEDRLRYGLEISDSKREELFAKIKRRTN